MNMEYFKWLLIISNDWLFLMITDSFKWLFIYKDYQLFKLIIEYSCYYFIDYLPKLHHSLQNINHILKEHWLLDYGSFS